MTVISRHHAGFVSSPIFQNLLLLLPATLLTYIIWGNFFFASVWLPDNFILHQNRIFRVNDAKTRPKNWLNTDALITQTTVIDLKRSWTWLHIVVTSPQFFMTDALISLCFHDWCINLKKLNQSSNSTSSHTGQSFTLQHITEKTGFSPDYYECVPRLVSCKVEEK